ncbi:hypothetical protein BKA80DRAFT_266298, partial [Phyllosticta citrichinensis]
MAWNLRFLSSPWSTTTTTINHHHVCDSPWYSRRQQRRQDEVANSQIRSATAERRTQDA